jgi:hypothetical protein
MGGRGWMILRRDYKILKVAEGGVIRSFLTQRRRGYQKNSLDAVLINN